MFEIKKVDEDCRGEISVVTHDAMKTPEISIAYTKKGYYRGGCAHPVHDEFMQVIEGIVEIYIKDENAPEPESDAGEGQHLKGYGLTTLIKGGLGRCLIPHHTPYYIFSKTDSVIVSWGADAGEKGKYDKECRGFVEEKNNERKNEDTTV